MVISDVSRCVRCSLILRRAFRVFRIPGGRLRPVSIRPPGRTDFAGRLLRRPHFDLGYTDVACEAITLQGARDRDCAAWLAEFRFE